MTCCREPCTSKCAMCIPKQQEQGSTTVAWQGYLQNRPNGSGRIALCSQGANYSGSTCNQTSRRHTPTTSAETEQVYLHSSITVDNDGCSASNMSCIRHACAQSCANGYIRQRTKVLKRKQLSIRGCSSRIMQLMCPLSNVPVCAPSCAISHRSAVNLSMGEKQANLRLRIS